MLFCSGSGLNVSTDWLQNVDALKESLKLAGSGSYDLNNIDISQFQGGLMHRLVTELSTPASLAFVHSSSIHIFHTLSTVRRDGVGMLLILLSSCFSF